MKLRINIRIVTAREWEGHSETWRIVRPGIIDTKDRKGKERENYLEGEVQALYSPPRRWGESHFTYFEWGFIPCAGRNEVPCQGAAAPGPWQRAVNRLASTLDSAPIRKLNFLNC